MSSRLVPVILCGGAGSRLWPLSREQHPKPFIRLPDGQSLLQKAFLRAAELDGVTQVIIVTNRDLVFKIEVEIAEVNSRNHPISLILEPFGRNTAAAVASAALLAAESDPETALLILAADHLIEDADAFSTAVIQAHEMADEGKLVTFGITPSEPETGYGYIEHEGETVVRFVEKPDLERAQAFLASGRFLWNSGMFCFRARTILEEFELHAPAILEAVQATIQHSHTARGEDFFQCDLEPSQFNAVPEDSFDYAIMERTRHAAVVPCDVGWSDIGSWRSLGVVGDHDENGNRLEGEVILHDVKGCFIRADERLIGAVGIENIIVVDTADALLVAHKDHSQNVKHLYTRLKAKGHEAHRFHQTVHRPWGTYTVLENGDGFKIKRIVVKPGASLSLQMHHHRSEHWIVVSGAATIVNGEEEIFLSTNQSTYIPAGHKHRMINPGKIDLVLIEVQSGQYLGEDDIVRFDDVYGRK
jgi:mannose-1-phosphate guanylyltransferase / mannose-6-phosphate isomerase